MGETNNSGFVSTPKHATSPSDDAADARRSDNARTSAFALTVVVPAFNCPGVLSACFEGLLASTLPRERWELIVVDDGSTDNTPDVARAVADRVLFTTNGPRGPGEARNVAAAVASGPILVFVDSDVVVAPGTLEGFVRAFDAHPEVASIFGAYDDAPGHPDFLSQYRNLLHHFVHTEHPGEAQTFWAGCGAVRTAAFLDVGGFDSSRYPRPQIEDIELGYRLGDHGYKIRLEPSLQGKHLKRWAFVNMVRTDVRDRARPWMHLLIERKEAVSHGPLNLRHKEKVLTVLSALSVILVLVALATADWRWALGAAACTAGVVLGNLDMFRWFASHRGLWFAARVVPMRLLFYILAGTGAAWAIVSHRFQPNPTKPKPLPDRRKPVAAV